MIRPSILIIDGIDRGARRCLEVTRHDGVRIAPTFADAVDLADGLSGPAAPDLLIDAALYRPTDRPDHLPAGMRADLDPNEKLACMQAEGRIGRLEALDLRGREWTGPKGIASDSTIVVCDGLGATELEDMLAHSDLHDADRWRCRDAATARARGGTLCATACVDRPLIGGSGKARLFHASAERIGNAGELLRTSAGRSLWASPSRAFAACFGAVAVRRGELVQGYDPLARGGQVVICTPSGALPEVLGGDYFLHELLVPRSALRTAGACQGHEYLIVDECEILGVSGALRANRLEEDFGVLVEQTSKAHPALIELLGCIPEPRIQEVFGMGRPEVRDYASHRRQLATWLPDELGVQPSRVPSFEPVAVLRLLRRCILPEIASMIRYADTPAHGIRHAWMVSHLALLIALLEDQPPVAPIVAAALHDCGRVGDDDDPHHPEIAAQVAGRILPRLRSASLCRARAAMVVEAVARHANVDQARDDVSAIVRDADRLALAWEHGVAPSRFATAWGLRLAHAGPAAAESCFRQILHTPLWDTVGLA